MRRGDPRDAGDVDFPVGTDDGAADLRELFWLALLDLDVGARGGLQVEARRGRGDDELDAVVPREHGEGVGADFVGRVAVAHDAVGTDDHRGDIPRGFLRREERAGHRVCDQRGRHALVDELEGCESAALVIGPCLGAKGVVQISGGV